MYEEVQLCCHVHPPPPSRSTQIHLSITVIVIYCTLLVFIFQVIFDDSIVYNSCTHISRGVDILLPNLYCCTVNI